MAVVTAIFEHAVYPS